MKRIEFLEHVVSGSGVEPMHSKVEAINKLPPPTTVSEVRHFMGMATYYCKFLPEFSRIKRPINALTRTDAKFVWGAEQQSAFEEIKRLLTSAQVLRNPDWGKKFNLNTD